MTETTATPYGGYSLTSIKEAGGEETPRFEAVITLDGNKVMHVSNGGFGGGHEYHGVGPDWHGFRDAMRDFETFARHWNEDSEWAGREDADALVYRLLEVADLNRRRTVVFTLDGESYFDTGVGRTLGSGVTFEQTVEYLRANHPGRSAAVWNKMRSEFIPVD